MIILNPQWQGIGSANPVSQGAKIIKELLGDLPYTEIPLDNTEIELEKGVYGLSQIEKLIEYVSLTIAEWHPNKIYTVGGDCSSDFAQLTYLNDLYQGEMGVIWVDAHPDINTPESSPSGNFHGMTLRTLCGEGPEELTRLIKRPLKPAQLIFCGTRSIDPEERRFIDEHQIPVISAERINQGNYKRTDFRAFKKIYLHIDIDCLDRTIFSDCATPTGPGLELVPLITLLQYLRRECDVIGGVLTEYGPKKEGANIDIIKRVLFQGLDIINGI